MRHGSLFSGIGGFDLAAEWMGWTNVFHCEWMEFPRKVLDYHFPDADSHIDICKTDFKKYANKIDILTGGFPCQPFSLAGKRKGTDDERYLWGEMLRAIQEIKPRFVIAENVFGITNIDGGLVFEQVCLDLETEGYEVQPFIIPASAKNAPHRRDRCWFIAYADGNDGRSTNRESGCQESETNGEGEQSVHSRIGTTSNEGDATNSKNCGCRGGMCQECADGKRKLFQNQQGGSEMGCEIERCGGIGNATNSTSHGLEHRDEAGNIRSEETKTRSERSKPTNVVEANGCDATNSNSNGFNERNGNDEINTSKRGEYALGDISTSISDGNVANTECSGRIQRIENLQSKESNGFRFIRNGRKRNATDTNGIGQESRYDYNTSDISKTYGLKQFCIPANWKKFPTQSPICGGDDGIPTELDGITFPKWRAESIKGYGNAIVPQVAYQLFQIINEL